MVGMDGTLSPVTSVSFLYLGGRGNLKHHPQGKLARGCLMPLRVFVLFAVHPVSQARQISLLLVIFAKKRPNCRCTYGARKSLTWRSQNETSSFVHVASHLFGADVCKSMDV